MPLDLNPLHEEVAAIMVDGPKPVHFKMECIIHTPEKEIRPLKVISLDIDRDYSKNYCDYRLLELLIPLGTYNHDIIPFKQELLIEVNKYPLPEGLEEIDEDSEIISRTFRGIMVDEHDDVEGVTLPVSENKDASDNMNPLRIEIQLLDLAIEQLRLIETGGIYRDEIPGEVLRYILTHVSERLDLPEEEEIIGVDVVEYDNQDPYHHIILPHGTKIQNVASIIQDDFGGIYNSGVGCYLQDNLWYIWPECNLTRFDKEKRTLTLINIPSNRYRGSERTYRMDDYQLIVVSTGETTHKDLSHRQQLDEGNAIRYTHGDPMLKDEGPFSKHFGESGKDNKFHIKRNENNSEYIAIDRPNYDVGFVSPARISNNSFSETSMLARRQGSFLSAVWEYSNPDLIYPGMPLRLMYLKENEVQELDGIVIKTHHYIHDPRPGINPQHRHLCNTNIVAFMAIPEEDESEDE